MVLLVVDTQKLITTENLYNFDEFEKYNSFCPEPGEKIFDKSVLRAKIFRKRDIVYTILHE